MAKRILKIKNSRKSSTTLVANLKKLKLTVKQKKDVPIVNALVGVGRGSLTGKQ